MHARFMPTTLPKEMGIRNRSVAQVSCFVASGMGVKRNAKATQREHTHTLHIGFTKSGEKIPNETLLERKLRYSGQLFPGLANKNGFAAHLAYNDGVVVRTSALSPRRIFDGTSNVASSCWFKP